MSAKGSETSQLDLKSELSVLARTLVEGDRAKALGLLTECLPKISAREGFMPAFIATLKAHGGRATALACVNTAREAFPKSTDLKLYRVDLLVRLGKLEAARLALAGLTSESHRPIYWKHKLAVAVGSDQLSVAQQGLEEFQDVPRDSQVLWHSEINVLMAQGEYDAATKKSSEALRTMQPSCSTCAFDLGP